METHCRYGFIDSTGKEILLPKNMYIENLGTDEWILLSAWNRNKKISTYRFMDKKGNIKPFNDYIDVSVDYEYNRIIGDNGLLAVMHKKDYLYSYIDTNNNVVIPPMFDYAKPFSQGLAVVGIYDSTTTTTMKCGYIDEEANWIVPPTYTKATSFINGLAIVAVPSGLPNTPYYHNIIDQQGNALLPESTYLSAMYSFGNYILYNKDGTSVTLSIEEVLSLKD